MPSSFVISASAGISNPDATENTPVVLLYAIGEVAERSVKAIPLEAAQVNWSVPSLYCRNCPFVGELLILRLSSSTTLLAIANAPAPVTSPVWVALVTLAVLAATEVAAETSTVSHHQLNLMYCPTGLSPVFHLLLNHQLRLQLKLYLFLR